MYDMSRKGVAVPGLRDMFEAVVKFPSDDETAMQVRTLGNAKSTAPWARERRTLPRLKLFPSYLPACRFFCDL